MGRIGIMLNKTEFELWTDNYDKTFVHTNKKKIRRTEIKNYKTGYINVKKLESAK